MNSKNKQLIIAALIVAAVLFLYFGTGLFGGGGMNGMMNDHNWTNGRMNGWFPVMIILAAGVLIGWIVFKKK